MKSRDAQARRPGDLARRGVPQPFDASQPEPAPIPIEVPGSGSVTAVRVAMDGSRLVFVYAPGAGSNINDPFGRYLTRPLAVAGVECWRLQFPYMEAGRRSPDRTPVLEATWRAVLEAAGTTGLPIVAGGRSMGGRIASQVAAQGADVAALGLFAYPLHPPGKPDQRRDAHLASIRVPTLFCSGTRDAFASPEELQGAAALVPDATVHLLEAADHGFATLKASGRSREDVWAEAAGALMAFLQEHFDL